MKIIFFLNKKNELFTDKTACQSKITTKIEEIKNVKLGLIINKWELFKR